MIFNVHCTCKILTAVETLTFKSLNFKNKQMYGCTMENVAYFLQYSGLLQPQTTPNNSC